MSEYIREIQTAYTGERYGAALFGALLERFEAEPARYCKLEQLRDLEFVTALRLAAVLERHGLQAPDSCAAEADARARAMEIVSWESLIETLLVELPGYVLKYDELLERVCPGDRGALDFLAAHERALLGFARAEGGGCASESADPIERLLLQTPR